MKKYPWLDRYRNWMLIFYYRDPLSAEAAARDVSILEPEKYREFQKECKQMILPGVWKQIRKGNKGMKRITGRNMYKIATVSMMTLLLAGTSVFTASAGGRTNQAVTQAKGGGTVAYTLQRETKMGLKPFTNIDIAVELADVTFLTAEDYGIEMSWCDERLKPDYQVKDGKLSVFTRQHGSLGLQRAIGGQVIIYLPETAILDQVSVKTDLGSIQIADRNITSMQAYCDAGDILLNRVSMHSKSGLRSGSITCSGQ